MNKHKKIEQKEKGICKTGVLEAKIEARVRLVVGSRLMIVKSSKVMNLLQTLRK